MSHVICIMSRSVKPAVVRCIKQRIRESNGYFGPTMSLVCLGVTDAALKMEQLDRIKGNESSSLYTYRQSPCLAACIYVLSNIFVCMVVQPLGPNQWD